MTYAGFDPFLLLRLPTDFRAHALVSAAPCWLLWKAYTLLMLFGYMKTFSVSYFLDIGGCLICSTDLRADRIIWWFLLVLGRYPSILVLGTGNNIGHYCVGKCWPCFTHLMTVRREGESVDYRVGIWSLTQYSLEVVLLCFCQLLIFHWSWVRTQLGGKR